MPSGGGPDGCHRRIQSHRPRRKERLCGPGLCSSCPSPDISRVCGGLRIETAFLTLYDGVLEKSITQGKEAVL